MISDQRMLILQDKRILTATLQRWLRGATYANHAIMGCWAYQTLRLLD